MKKIKIVQQLTKTYNYIGLIRRRAAIACVYMQMHARAHTHTSCLDIAFDRYHHVCR